MSTALAVIPKIIHVPSGKIVPSKKKKKKKGRGNRGEGSLYLRGEVWWYRTPDGQSYSTSTKINSEAIDFKLRKLAEINSGDKPHIKSKAPGVTVNQLLDLHISQLKRENCASADDVAAVIAKHVRPYFGDRVASSITTADLEKYRNDKNGVVAESTINRHLSYIRAAYNTGRERSTPRLVEQVPYFPMADESEFIRQGFIEHEGYKKIWDGLSQSLKPLFVCAYHVGTRKGELQKVRWPQVDFDQQMIILKAATTKNRSGRVLPIYGDMMEVLKAQKQFRDAHFPDCEYVFFWQTTKEIHNAKFLGSRIKQFLKSWDNVVADAGYPDLIFHDLRRSAARNMRLAGLGETEAMEITGHKTADMYRRYDIFTGDEVAGQKIKMQAFHELQEAKAVPQSAVTSTVVASA